MPTINSVKRPWHSKDKYRRKPEKDSFLNNQPWRKLRRRKLMNDPLCEECKRRGRIVEATIVDHKQPRRFYPELKLEYTNLMSLCKSHHESKSSRESRIKSKEDYEG